MRNQKVRPILWVFLLILCAAPAYAQETSGYCGRQSALNVDSTNLQWNYDTISRVLTISGDGRMKDYSLESKAPWYQWQSEIQNVKLAEQMTSIGSYALYNLSQLRHLHIPRLVSSIGRYAFRYMTALDSISVDGANTSYDSRNGCNALIESNSHKLVLGCIKTRIPSNVVAIDSCAFRNVSGLKKIVIPESVTKIEKEAFNGCTKLDSVTLPSTLKAISDYTFQDCSSLDTIVLPATLEFIGIRAFSNCSSLPNVTLPASIDSLDQYIFSGCSGLKYIKCDAPTPPRIHQTTFRGTSCHIYVPCESIGAYRDAPVWEDFDTLMTAWYDLVLRTRSNDDALGWDTILQMPDCETNAIIYAKPYDEDNYEFVAWEDTLGNTISKDRLYEFPMDEDMTLIAVFRKIPEGLDAIDANTRVWVDARSVMVLACRDTEAVLYDMTGRRVDRCSVTADVPASLHAPIAGVYVTIVNGKQRKVIVQ